MKLPKSCYQWALKHLVNESDSDVFPRPFEIDVMRRGKKELLAELQTLEVDQYEWKAGRRFIVPKHALGFRTATQLDPFDSLVLAAMIKCFGQKIEMRRIPESERRVFSYRFKPQNDGRFYGPSSNWHTFWEESLRRSSDEHVTYVAIVDITDFYNQINHHVLENELKECGVPKPILNAIRKLLLRLSERQSRGIPVGPHSARLLAECSLISMDKSLCSHGYNFTRYVDDVHFFCSSQDAAQIAIHDFAEILDKHQKLTIQERKTEILDVPDFKGRAESYLVDRPLNEQETEILRIIREHTKDNQNPYEIIALEDISEDDWTIVNSDSVGELIGLYLTQDPVNHPRLGWLLRRLSQVGAPAALPTVLANFRALVPILGDVAKYIVRASENVDNLPDVGKAVLESLDIPLVQHSDYLRIVLLNLFSQIPSLDHINVLTQAYDGASPAVRRELILAAWTAGAGHWIKERKADFETGDVWFRRAMLAASKALPGDEAQHWLKNVKPTLEFGERLVQKWA